MAARLKISMGGIFEKFSARGYTKNTPILPPISVACWYVWTFYCLLLAIIKIDFDYYCLNFSNAVTNLTDCKFRKIPEIGLQ